MIVYRGFAAADIIKKPSIIWVSTSKEHAEMYSYERRTVRKSGVVSFTIVKKIQALDLGFRAAETSVPFQEIQCRLFSELTSARESNKVNELQAQKIIEKLRALNYSGIQPVWSWMHKPPIIEMIKQMGFNAIQQREGLKLHAGNIITYGILDHSLLSNPTKLD